MGRYGVIFGKTLILEEEEEGNTLILEEEVI